MQSPCIRARRVVGGVGKTAELNKTDEGRRPKGQSINGERKKAPLGTGGIFSFAESYYRTKVQH
jgi:hypothetical protein